MAERRPWHYLVAIGILAAGWEALAIALAVPAFPRLGPALVALWQGVAEGELLLHTWVSLCRVAYATALALILGVPLGLYLGRSGGPIGSVLVYLTHPIPKVVFLPVIMVVLGIGDLSKVFMIFLILFFQILVTVRDGAAAVEPGHLIAVTALGARGWQVYRHVVIPATLPRVFTALRLSTATAVAVLFFAETYATTHGLGAYVWDAWSARDYDDMFAGVIAMAVLGFGFHTAADLLERVCCPWVRAQVRE
ncbi:MAG: ABC transporter permease [Bacillota bacterium]|nr:MAG: ABC transporter permease [Bacillota bacterium]